MGDFIKDLISSDGIGPWRSQLCGSVANLRTSSTAAPSAPPLRPRETEVLASTVCPAASRRPRRFTLRLLGLAAGFPGAGRGLELGLVPMSEPGRCITPNNDQLEEKDTTAGAHTAREGSTPERGVLLFPSCWRALRSPQPVLYRWRN